MDADAPYAVVAHRTYCVSHPHLSRFFPLSSHHLRSLVNLGSLVSRCPALIDAQVFDVRQQLIETLKKIQEFEEKVGAVT